MLLKVVKLLVLWDVIKKMQNNLIGRSTLMNDIISTFRYRPYIEVGNTCEYIHEIIERQPTSYNVEKVLEQLEEESEFVLYEMNEPNMYAGIERAIEIVRKGGVDNAIN